VLLNFRIALALGEVSSKEQFASIETIQKYQFALQKIAATPLGITFYNTRQFVTFDIIVQVSTLVFSFFLFIASVKNTTSPS
jgi:hypothetical protein